MKTNCESNQTIALDGAPNPQAHLTVRLPVKSTEHSPALRKKLALIVPCMFALL